MVYTSYSDVLQLRWQFIEFQRTKIFHLPCNKTRRWLIRLSYEIQDLFPLLAMMSLIFSEESSSHFPIFCYSTHFYYFHLHYIRYHLIEL